MVTFWGRVLGDTLMRLIRFPSSKIVTLLICLPVRVVERVCSCGPFGVRESLASPRVKAGVDALWLVVVCFFADVVAVVCDLVTGVGWGIIVGGVNAAVRASSLGVCDVDSFDESGRGGGDDAMTS